jgi:hypothetical protein
MVIFEVLCLVIFLLAAICASLKAIKRIMDEQDES